MIGAVLVAALLAAPGDSIPRISLAEALNRATRLDPNYVSALASVSSADWARRSAFATLVLPAISVATDYTTYSTEIFNTGTAQPAKTIVTARADARFELFNGGRHLADVRRTRAELESAVATEVQVRYISALQTESAFYAALSEQELRGVAQDRLRRALEQLVVARARVVSGAVVQTDSLQILLEVNRARVGLIREEARLNVARLQLGRRVGENGPVEALPADTLHAPALPLSLPEAIAVALEQGPDYRIARANERGAVAALRAQKASYFPTLALSANISSFDERYFPTALTRSFASLSLSFPLWNNFARELGVARARAGRDVAQAIRSDVERAAAADVTDAYQAYETARAATDYAVQGLTIAQETFRVQQARYRAGASTILDLLEAQTGLTEAESELVQSRYAIRLALAGLEAVLGRRLFELKE
ncbi:MAG: TolC family protein [Gemmatimonadota bacterium]